MHSVRRATDEPISDRHRDLAFALQSTIEAAVVHMARALSKRHPSRNLCLTGGVALNCVANARSCATRTTRLSGYHLAPRTQALPSAAHSGIIIKRLVIRAASSSTFFPRPGYTDAEITSALKSAGLAYRRLEGEELLTTVAGDIAAGKIVGWFQGRSELGPAHLEIAPSWPIPGTKQ